MGLGSGGGEMSPSNRTFFIKQLLFQIECFPKEGIFLPSLGQTLGQFQQRYQNKKKGQYLGKVGRAKTAKNWRLSQVLPRLVTLLPEIMLVEIIL